MVILIARRPAELTRTDLIVLKSIAGRSRRCPVKGMPLRGGCERGLSARASSLTGIFVLVSGNDDAP